MQFARFFLLFLFTFTPWSLGYSTPSEQNLYKLSQEVLDNNSSDQFEEDLLFEFYSNMAAAMDVQTLEKNPELIFRKAIAESCVSFESIETLCELLIKLRKDFQFVVKHAEKDTLLFEAAQFKIKQIDAILQGNPRNEDDLDPIITAFYEEFLRKWATHPEATGIALREEVLSNLLKNEALAASFYHDVLLLADEPNCSLGYVKLHRIEVTEITYDKKGVPFLVCEIEFHDDKRSYEMIFEF